MVHTEEQSVNSWSEQHLTQQSNIKHYPHYWWSFTISLLIIIVFFIIVYIKYIRPQIQLHRQQYHQQQLQSYTQTPAPANPQPSSPSTSSTITNFDRFLHVFRKQKDWKPATSKRASTAIINIGAYHAQTDTNYHSLGIEKSIIKNPWLRLNNTYYEDTDHSSMDDNEYIFGKYSSYADMSVDMHGNGRKRMEKRLKNSGNKKKNVKKKRKFLKEREREIIGRDDRIGSVGSGSVDDDVGGSVNDNCIMFKGKVRYNYENEFLMNQFMNRICAPMLEEDHCRNEVQGE